MSKVTKSKKKGLNNVEKSQVKRMLNNDKETDRINHSASSIAMINGDATFTLVNGIAQGTNVGQRIGMQISNHRLFGNFIVRPNATPGNANWRVMIVYGRQDKGIAPADADDGILDSVSAVALPVFLRRKRFQILYDRRGTFSAQGNDVARYHTFNIKLKGKRTTYDGTGALISDIEKGAIWFLHFSDGSTSLPNISYEMRLLYKDG